MPFPQGGQTRADPPGEMIMTQDKARKTATRQRMAETGEPYSVARHAVENEADAESTVGGSPGEQGDSQEQAGQQRDSQEQAGQQRDGETRSYAEQAQELAERARRRA